VQGKEKNQSLASESSMSGIHRGSACEAISSAYSSPSSTGVRPAGSQINVQSL